MDSIFYELFESLPRQGPGDDLSTERAFRKLMELPIHPDILDVGCGSGKPTLALARLTKGNITALDNHAPFLEIFKRNIHGTDNASRIRCVVGDMASMNFAVRSFDVIWSEGAVFIMGFEKALNHWKPLLRENGYIVISELVWFNDEAPQEIKEYFTTVYPAMKPYREFYPILDAAGYTLVDYFPLPAESWWIDYYAPAGKKLVEMRSKYNGNKDAQMFFDSFQLEIDMHRKYSEYYGYGFYVMKLK
jgi:SAM-dependent methyltransferase